MADSSKKILIVDDEPAMLNILEFILLKNGYEVYQAGDGAEALKIVHTHTPDLIITDVMMPVVNGYEFVRRLKLSPDVSDIPVIMLTAQGGEKERVSGLSVGADDYIPKPFNVKELILRVQKLLSYKERIVVTEVKFAETRKLLELGKEELAEAYARLEKLTLESLESLITALEARDSYTRGHSERVARYAGSTACAMNISDVNSIVIASRFHDIGKIGTSDFILYKKGKLTDEEWEIIKSHPVKGAEIIRKISFLRGIVPVIKYHHERCDGCGYPEGLKGEAIPLAARIIAVADTFDAIRSKRPYRDAMPLEVAISELKKYSESQFDPDVVDAFIKLIPTESSEDIL